MKKIKKSNKKFRAMTAAQKRVAIAKDVIAQIKCGKFSINAGFFGTIHGADGSRTGDAADQKFLKSKQFTSCEVCAVGAAIVSGIRLFNKVQINDGEITCGSAMGLATQYFTEQQVRLIENAFEMGNGNFADYSDDYIAAIEFGENYEEDEDRAIAIFTNIIRNKGTFRP